MKLIGLEKQRIAKAEAEAAAKVFLLKTRRAGVESKSKELDEYLSAEKARLAKQEDEQKKVFDAREAELKAERAANQAAYELAERAYTTKIAELDIMMTQT